MCDQTNRYEINKQNMQHGLLENNNNCVVVLVSFLFFLLLPLAGTHVFFRETIQYYKV